MTICVHACMWARAFFIFKFNIFKYFFMIFEYWFNLFKVIMSKQQSLKERLMEKKRLYSTKYTSLLSCHKNFVELEPKNPSLCNELKAYILYDFKLADLLSLDICYRAAYKILNQSWNGHFRFARSSQEGLFS